MTRNDYMAALTAAKRIVNPTVEQMLTVCPHLTREQALEGLMGSGNGYIALPPLKIRYSIQIANYSPGNPELDFKPIFNGGWFNRRTPRSYADGKPHGDSNPANYAYAAEAMAYAEEHWPEALILDTWTDFQEVYVQDPTDLRKGVGGGVPKTKFVISIGLGRKWNDLINDHSKPEVQLWDDAIVVACVDRLVSTELQGGRGGFTEFNCAHCGGGLGLSACTACGHEYANNQSHCGWSTPLPPKLVQLLRVSGHEFALSPERLLAS